jgi:hypothetical protein
MMMCNDFGLFTTRKDSYMNGRAGGGWIEPTIVDWISMSSNDELNKEDFELDELGNPVPPPVDPPVLSTRGYLPITKEEIKKIFQKVSGTRNQFKYVKKVGFLWVLYEMIKLGWSRIHADQINFERELNSSTALETFRRVATKYVRDEYERKWSPQYNILKSNGAIAYQLWSNRSQREFAEDEFNHNYHIIAVVTKQWIPISEEEDEDGMYEFGEGYEPMELRTGMVLRLKEGMYNDNEYGLLNDETDGFSDDAYFSPLRRTMGEDGETIVPGNAVENVDALGVKVYYGKDATTTNGLTGIFPANCIRLTRVDYTFTNPDFGRDEAAIRIQSLGRGVVFRMLRTKYWKASTTIQKYVRGVLQRLWWKRAILVRSSRAEYNVATLLDAVTTEDKISTLLHRMGLESFTNAIKTTGIKSERGFRFAQGNARLVAATKGHRTTSSVPKWMESKSGTLSRNPKPMDNPRRQVSNARAKKRIDDHNQLNLRSYQLPRSNDNGMLDQIISEFEMGLHMVYHAYSSQIGKSISLTFMTTKQITST